MISGHNLTEDPIENTPRYYDMRGGRFRYVDGSQWENLEPEIGLGGTGIPIIIRSILRGVNQMELREEEEEFF